MIKKVVILSSLAAGVSPAAGNTELKYGIRIESNDLQSIADAEAIISNSTKPFEASRDFLQLSRNGSGITLLYLKPMRGVQLNTLIEVIKTELGDAVAVREVPLSKMVLGTQDDHSLPR